MTKRVILFSLQTFSTTGGIQKMTRTLAHSLNSLAVRNNWDFELWSAYDADNDLLAQYLPAKGFTGFNKNRIAIVINTIFNSKKPDLIILSHINLAVIGLLIKVLHPKCKVWVIAHGIEVWRPLSLFKNMFLKACDKIICVSNFTKQQVVARHQVAPGKCEILNNAIDPFIKLPQSFEKPVNLLERYSLTAATPVIFTLTRLASTEQYKGHDQVIKIMGTLKLKFPHIKYILSGQYDQKEKIRIEALIAEADVAGQVILTGFIEEAEVADHFLLADLFVLPSKKEGFGLVFIEALACGLPVVCGNADGSIDAICNGELGTAVNVDDLNELENSITNYLLNPLTQDKRRSLQEICVKNFNEEDYINKIKNMLDE